MNCECIDKYIESRSGGNFPETGVVGRRFSLDKKSDSSGVRLLSICKEAGLWTVNGRLGVDKGQGIFTYQSVLGKSVIDNVLFQPECFENVTQFIVHDIFTFSDHAPLQLSLKMKRNVFLRVRSAKFTKLFGKRLSRIASEILYQTAWLTLICKES